MPTTLYYVLGYGLPILFFLSALNDFLISRKEHKQKKKETNGK